MVCVILYLACQYPDCFEKKFGFCSRDTAQIQNSFLPSSSLPTLSPNEHHPHVLGTQV